MNVSLNPNNKYAFTGREKSQESKDAEKKIVAGGGVVAATASTVRKTQSRFDIFKSAGKVSKGMATTAELTATADKTAKQAKGLWGKVCENAKWAKNAIVQWGEKFVNMKYIKPLIHSKAFRFVAGILGYGFGIVTLIYGVNEIAETTTKSLGNKFLKADE